MKWNKEPMNECMKWNEMNWTELKWNEMKWNEMKEWINKHMMHSEWSSSHITAHLISFSNRDMNKAPSKDEQWLHTHTHTKNSQRERLDPFHVQLKCIDSYPFFLKKTNAIELCLIFLSLNQQDKRWLQRLSRDVVIASMGACLARAVDCRDAPCGCFQADGCCVSPRGLLGGWGVSGRVHVSS